MRSAAAAAHEKMKTEWDVEAAISTYNVDGWGLVTSRSTPPAMPKSGRSRKKAARSIFSTSSTKRGIAASVFRSSSGSRICCGTASNRSTAPSRKRSTEFGYKNHYRGVFPIKVNQLREVVEEIVDAGQEFHFGLEAGSKPELVAALAMHKDPESLIICNGYKDRAFIRIALLGRKLGKTVIIVVEKLEELEQTIRASKEVGVEPHDRHPRALLQQRRRQMVAQRRREREVRPRHRQPRRGERDAESRRPRRIASSSFISTSARRCPTFPRSSAPCAKRRAITPSFASSATSSATSTSAAGSGVDYDGSRSDFDSSTNYSLQEYASDVVWNIMDVCDSEGVAASGDRERRRARDRRASFRARRRGVRLHRENARRSSRSRCSENDHKLVARHSRREAASQARQPAREFARHPADQGGSAADVRRSACSISSRKRKIETRLLADRRADRQHASRPALRARGSRRSSRPRSPTSTSATSPSSSRCSITGRSASCSRSCRSTA